MTFRRSSFCSTDHVTEQCVEVSIRSRYVFVRSTNSETEVAFTHDEFAAFLAGVKAGEFDVPGR